MDLFLLMLYLHIMGAIVAFGPGFAAMVVGPMVAAEPQHANWYVRSQVFTAKRLVTPVGATMLLTGAAMIGIRGWTSLTGGRYWLSLGILLYIVAFGFAQTVQARNARRLVELTSTPPAPGTPPDPAIPATAGRLRTGGLLMSLLVAVIVFLMVTKPF